MVEILRKGDCQHGTNEQKGEKDMNIGCLNRVMIYNDQGLKVFLDDFLSILCSQLIFWKISQKNDFKIQKDV